MSKTANWNYPTSVRFGVGRIKELPELCLSVGMQRPLLVTDRGLGSAPITLAALDSLKAAGLGAALFCELKPNPVESNLTAGLEAYR
ncbi:MAG: iron-containing alcohol dehydrogenase, partial [Pseudomonas sp.]